MPRSQQSPLGKVLEYFRTVNLATLPDAYGLVQDIVRQRQGRSQQAKKAAKAPAPTGTTTAAASPASTEAVATPKAKKKPGPKKSHKKKVPQALPGATAGPSTGQGQTLSVPLPDAGADPDVLQPIGDEFDIVVGSGV